MINYLKKQRASSLLGLSLDGNRLEGVVLRRTNGALEVQKTFSVVLSLDPLTNDSELVGQEIRNHLEEAGIRERRCAVVVPLSWALTLQTKLPELPEADISSFLQIEAERGFPYGPDALVISDSRFRSPGGQQFATQVAVPKDHILRLEKALKTARLKPVTFSLGIAALQSADTVSAAGVLALAVGENTVGLQVSGGGGVAALRALEGSLEIEDGQKRIHADVVAREIRITLGQLPAEMRDAVRRVRVFGNGDLARQLTEEVRVRLEAAGMRVERVTGYPAGEFGVQLPSNTSVSPALSLAARHLVGHEAGLDFLPPKTNSWQQFTTRYSSKKLFYAGATAATIALLSVGAFFIQQWQLSRLHSQWSAISVQVTELENLQQQIRKFRPWFNDSLPSLSILRRLAEAFPEDGVVSVKTLEIREPGDNREISTITCTGSALNNKTLQQTLDRLSAAAGVSDVHAETRGTAPLQFTFNFHWNEQGGYEH